MKFKIKLILSFVVYAAVMGFAIYFVPWHVTGFAVFLAIALVLARFDLLEPIFGIYAMFAVVVAYGVVILIVLAGLFTMLRWLGGAH